MNLIPPTPTKRRYPLDLARAVAGRLVEELRASCERIEIVGSIRRGRPRVHDIDVIVLPKYGPPPRRPDQLFADQVEVSLLDGALERLAREEPPRLRYDSMGQPSKGWRIRRYIAVRSGIPVDLYAATPASWWTQLVIRTGSADHNKFLCSLAHTKGLKLHAGGEGLTGPQDQAISLQSEEEVFRMLDLAYIAPSAREIRTSDRRSP